MSAPAMGTAAMRLGAPRPIAGGLAGRCQGWFLRRGRWTRRLSLMILGAIASLAFAPVYALPCLAIGMIGLIWAAETASRRRDAFAIGWWWGFGHFLGGTFWIANSFLIDPVQFGWMVPPVIAGLSAYLAMYPALAVALAWWRGLPLPIRILILPVSWMLAEWLRGHLMTGFPWNLAAYVWGVSDPMMQSASFWGSWGLGAVTVLMCGLLALTGRGNARANLSAGVAFLVLLVGLYGFGAWRLNSTEVTGTGIMLRLVQGNISQIEKLTGARREQHVDQHLRLSVTTPGLERAKAVIWPETAATYFLDRRPDWRQYVAEAAPPGGYVITGNLRGDPPEGNPERYWNSLAVLTPNGSIVAASDKFHLVPLGEYVPLRDIFGDLIGKLTAGAGDFSAGPGPVTVRVPGLPPFSPLICYEVIFPGAVLDAADRPAWLLNVTNDGWFGQSPGPYQHLATARFRAIEEGLPLARAANTGITAMIDPYGRIVASLPLGQEGVLDAALPQALNAPLFARFGVMVPIILAALLLITAVFAARILRN